VPIPIADDGKRVARAHGVAGAAGLEGMAVAGAADVVGVNRLVSVACGIGHPEVRAVRFMSVAQP
jgi:hypothetical protein